MKPIVEYSDFRQYMRDYYEERKRCSVFSWREFSKVAGFTSSSYMKVVCDGKSKLSRVGVERTGAAMGLVGFEMEYFRAMVEYGQAEVEAKKKAAYEKMLSVARTHKVRVMEGELFEFYDSWHNPVVRELAPLMPGATPGDIAKMCCSEVSAADVQKSLNFLTRAGLLKKAGQDAFVLAETSIRGTPDATRLALRGMHRQMSELATPAVDLPVDERHFSGVTMGLSNESYRKIENVLDECRRKIIAIAAEDKDVDQVYRLNLQLFPLSKKVKERKNEEV
ncbi:TIGR02147 family protein [Fibrobacter sp. UWR2]|uniref:TIGR02147 family protein n=1 Tax=Fibrobacter sp. UWR2 TaxID=1964352 RepID=UPI000B51FB5D|nr:TIGR02147 family protein [Fibrobacter sp. UWR2]OWV01685.1 TIGR02147 family protein [Fibrobacter sp. UWR2]